MIILWAASNLASKDICGLPHTRLRLFGLREASLEQNKIPFAKRFNILGYIVNPAGKSQESLEERMQIVFLTS